MLNYIISTTTVKLDSSESSRAKIKDAWPTKEPFMEFEDTEFTEKDDRRAQAILTKLGIIGRFGDEPRRKRHMTMVTFSDHPTHWIIGCRFSGNSDPAQNGFVVHGMPKSKCSQAVFDQFVQELNNRDNSGTGLIRRPKPPAGP